MAIIRVSAERLEAVAQQMVQVDAQTTDMLRRLGAFAMALQSDWQGMGQQEFMYEFQNVQALAQRNSQAAQRMHALLTRMVQQLTAMNAPPAAGPPPMAGGGGNVIVATGSEQGIAAGGAVSGGISGAAAVPSAPYSGATVTAGISDTASGAVISAGPGDSYGGQYAGGELPSQPADMGGGAGPGMASSQAMLAGVGTEVAIGGAEDPLAMHSTPAAGFGAAQPGAAMHPGEAAHPGEMASTPANLGSSEMASTPVDLSGGGALGGHAGAGLASSQSLMDIVPKLQHDSDNCGKTAVAMAVNAIMGTNLEDTDLPAEGCSLLAELNARSEGSGVQWVDQDLSADTWPHLEKSLSDGVPVVVGLNGEFSASGYGHIVTIVGVEGEQVTYADPATGQLAHTTRQAILDCPPHTDGKFMMFGQRTSS